MKAADIRIGSLFYPINRGSGIHLPETAIAFQVYSVDHFKVKACLGNRDFAQTPESEIYEFNIRDLSPIPLTEEWLLKFGFEQNVPMQSSAAWYKQFVKIEDKRSYTDEIYRFKYSVLDLRMIYVHEIQNLYFALTGEELIIK